MTDAPQERRASSRTAQTAEMLLGSSRAPISNLSRTGAFVAILTGLQPGDGFRFELPLETHGSISGRAVVQWTDPGVGVGVRFELTGADADRLADYLKQLDTGDAIVVEPDPNYDPPRRSARRTIAVGSSQAGGPTRVWFHYLPPSDD